MIDEKLEQNAAQRGLLEATGELLAIAETEGMQVLQMRDYGSVTVAQLAFELDILEAKVRTLERELFCLQIEAQKSRSKLHKTPFFKRLMSWRKRGTLKR